MKATEILMEEHRHIERVVNSLDLATTRLARGEKVYLRFFIDAAVFIKSFVDDCHHKKEEQVLFPSLVKNGLSKESGPVAMMLAEHEAGRLLTQQLRQSTEQLQSGDSQASEQVVQSAMGYIKLLRQHIYKEDNILFPLADKVIPAAEQPQLEEAYQPFDHDEAGQDVHDKYYGLAERLQMESMR